MICTVLLSTLFLHMQLWNGQMKLAWATLGDLVLQGATALVGMQIPETMTIAKGGGIQTTDQSL